MADDRGRTSASSPRSAPIPAVPPGCVFPVCEHVEHIKQEWESTVDALPQLVCLLDGAGLLVRCNRTAERWGLGSVAEVGGRCLHDLMHPGCALAECELKRFIEDAYAWLRCGEDAHWQGEDPILGRHLDVQLRPHLHPGAAAAVRRDSHVVAVIDDITELRAAERGLQALSQELEQRIAQRTALLDAANRELREEAQALVQAQAELQQSRDKYQQLVDTMSEGLAVRDTHDRIRYVNARFAQMLGYAVDDVVGRDVTDFIDESCLEDWEAQMARRGGGDVTPYEILLKGNRGRRIWGRISPNLIFDAAGACAGSFAVISDVSDRVQAEQALRESERELRLLSAQVLTAQEKERQRIAAELHDGIGQTLSAIKFYVENSLAQAGDDPPHHHALLFKSIVPKLQGAVEEVRRIAMDLRPSILDDLGILATLGWFCREYQSVYLGIRVELGIEAREADVPAPLKVVVFRIVQEALNNVAKHARTDVVRIALKKVGDAVELDIADNGIGFDLTEIAATRGFGVGGTGLASMRERAEYSGGHFTLRSGKGQGTRIGIVWETGAARGAPPAGVSD